MHYQFLENDDFSFGLTGGFRNYGYHYVDEPGKDTANMQRWKIAPDWDVKLTEIYVSTVGCRCINLPTI